jgi:hypothetical protein
MSGNGDVMAMGGLYDNLAGAVWVFKRDSNGAWNETVKLKSTIPGTVNFGRSIAMSDDGNTIVVGVLSTTGGALVFVYNGSTWVQQGGLLVGSGYAGSPNQGFSVAISKEGNTLALGGPGDASNVGAAWVFTRSGVVWTQQGSKLVGSGYVGSPQIGTSLAFTEDGNTLVIGGVNDNTLGAIWIFKRSSGVWSQFGSKLFTSQFGFGYSVAINYNGNIIAVGTPYVNSSVGMVSIYELINNTWVLSNNIFPNNNISTAQFGTSVSLTEDGNTLAVGGISDNFNSGAVWIYTRNPYENVWTYRYKFTVPDPNASFGNSVALSRSGNTLVGGSPGFSSDNGAVWIYG